MIYHFTAHAQPNVYAMEQMSTVYDIYLEYITLVANLTQEIGCQLGKVQLISGAKV